MSAARLIAAAVCLVALGSCGKGRRGSVVVEPDPFAQDDLADFVASWLEPVRTPITLVQTRPVLSRIADVEARARPLRPQQAEWNRWPDGTARLFNDRAGWLVELRLAGPHQLRWLPAGTGLELNEPGAPIRPARTPDVLLQPLLMGALEQERNFLQGDLMERTRAAGPFRAAYLPLSAQDQVLEGVIAFPTPGGPPQVRSMRLTVAVAVDDRPESLVFVWE